ncbi:MAG: AI-2E family transporter [Parcubacteria group bacterium]|nr:AI-2E family transporter [Parcubacteria group bacterium]
MTDKNVQIYFFVAVFLAVLALNVAMFLPFIGAVVLALTLTVAFRPVYNWILKRLGGRAGLSSLATVLLTVLIIIIPIAFLSTLVFKEASVVYSIFRDGSGEAYVGDLNRIINTQLQNISPGLSFDFMAVFEKILNFFVRNLGSVFSGVSGAVFSLFLALMALYYLLKDGDRLKKVIMSLSPLADEYDDQVFNKLSLTVSSVIKGSLLVAVIQGVLTGAGFFIFGIPNPAIWGTIGIIAALIPMLGTALVIIPGLIYLFSIGSSGAALGLLLWGAVIVGSVDNLLRPKLFERGINIHPFFILISVLGGLEFFGAVGFLLGPLLLSLLFSLLDIYKKEFKRDVEQ